MSDKVMVYIDLQKQTSPPLGTMQCNGETACRLLLNLQWTDALLTVLYMHAQQFLIPLQAAKRD